MAQPARRKSTAPDGVLLLDKPEGITSHAAIQAVKRALRVNKIGHCGTLDPFATGVLVVLINRATRIADLLLTQGKRYRFSLELGSETDTLDRTGTITRRYSGAPVATGELQRALRSFEGEQLQIVPRYAAVKVNGRRLYEWTRAGIDVPRPQRRIVIESLALLDYRWPRAVLEVTCSKGTYIRQLAEDIGRTLGCGAHVADLRRLASGSFALEQALSLAKLQRLGADGGWQDHLIAVNEALAHLPAVTVEDPQVESRLRDGHLVPAWEAQQRLSFEGWSSAVRLVDRQARLLALWWPKSASGQRRLRLLESL